MIFQLLAWWLRTWEERGASPMRLALYWGLSVALFFLALCAAFFYSSVKLQLLNPSDAAWVLGIMGVLGTPMQFLIVNKMSLERISARAAGNAGAVTAAIDSGSGSRGGVGGHVKPWRMLSCTILGSLVVIVGSIGGIRAVEAHDFWAQQGWTVLAVLGGVVVWFGLRRSPKTN